MQGSDEATVVRWAETPEPAVLVAAIEAIFFATAGPRQFADDAERAAFRQRWLGEFLDIDPGLVFVGLTADGGVAGYLVGCLTDPATSARFAALSYFHTFAPLTARYPAHLHVNLGSAHRGAGLGARLVGAFVAAAAAAGSPGVHVVTGRAARNVGFYNRIGFLERGAMTWNGRDIVFLGRDLSRP